MSGNWKDLRLGMHQYFAEGGLKMQSSAGQSFFRHGCTGGFESQKSLGLIWGEQAGFSCGVYWKMVFVQGVVMGAWVLNLHHTNGLKPDFKLFPLTVK